MQISSFDIAQLPQTVTRRAITDLVAVLSLMLTLPTAADVRLNMAFAPIGADPAEFRPLQDAVAVLVETTGGEVLFQGDQSSWLVVHAPEESLGLLRALPLILHVDQECIGWQPPCSTMPTNANLVVTAAARMELLDIVADFGGTASAGTVQPNGDFYFELTVPVEALEPIDALDGVSQLVLDVLPQLGGRLLELGEGLRFHVLAEWRTASAQGIGQARFLTRDTGAFYFFRPDNLEIMVKVLDGCAINGYYWVFLSGLTNVGVTVEVISPTDSKVYESELGTTFQTVTDTAALLCQ